MLLDDSEYEDIQATSLSAVKQFGDEEEVAQGQGAARKV